MILEVALGVLGAGVAASGWIYAYRSRGESRADLTHANEAAERARLAEAARDALQAKLSEAEANRAAAAAELKSTAAALEVTRGELELERRAKVDLLAKLAKLGAPVGPVLVDSSIDRLYADRSRRGTEDPNGHGDEDRRGGKVSDDAPHPAGGPTRPK